MDIVDKAKLRQQTETLSPSEIDQLLAVLDGIDKGSLVVPPGENILTEDEIAQLLAAIHGTGFSRKNANPCGEKK